MELEKVARIAIKAGEILLKNGSDTHRIEETVALICKAYGHTAECVSLPYGIFIEFINNDPAKEKTIMKKISGRDFDLHKIELVNAFSRSLNYGLLPYEEALSKLQEIDDSPSFSILTQSLAAGLTGGVYTLLFKGSFFDAMVASGICMLVQFLILKSKTTNGVLQYVVNFIAGFIMGFMALAASQLFPQLNSHFINTGSIMILVPGIILTNGLKDFIYGHYYSGLGKIFNAILIVSIVAIGVGFALMLFRSGGILQ